MRRDLVGALLATVALALGASTSALADHCKDCKDKVRTADVGVCRECRGGTASGASRFCAGCSRKLGLCEDCGAKLGPAAPSLTPAEAEAKAKAFIAELGSDEFEKRERAERGLVELGAAAIPVVRKAAVESADAEVRARCAKLAKEHDLGRFRKALLQALESDRELVEEVKKAAHAGADRELDAAALKEAGACTALELDDVAAAFEEPIGFFAVRLGSWRVPGEPARRLHVQPASVVRLGVDDKEKVFLVPPRAGEPVLAPRLKAVRDRDGAVKAAIVAARLLAFCRLCKKDLRVEPGRCTAAEVEGGGYEVTIPSEALAPKSDESAVVTFSKDGKLERAKATGRPHGHQ